ncbi:hypothetical protein HY639_05330 [Candidatus Woesearchaeota archaeon]|nr:hypothetical protein [Candidatus Woesearchaeota archaeon]
MGLRDKIEKALFVVGVAGAVYRLGEATLDAKDTAQELWSAQATFSRIKQEHDCWLSLCKLVGTGDVEKITTVLEQTSRPEKETLLDKIAQYEINKEELAHSIRSTYVKVLLEYDAGKEAWAKIQQKYQGHSLPVATLKTFFSSFTSGSNPYK